MQQFNIQNIYLITYTWEYFRLSLCSIITFPYNYSEEIGGGVLWGHFSITVGHGLEQLCIPIIDCLEFQYGGDVTTAVAIVWCRPNCY